MNLFRFVVYIVLNWVIYSGTPCISCSLVKQVCSVEIPKPFLVTNDYLRMLQSFPELTKPPNRDKPVKHDVVHEIETNGYPCNACAHLLTPEKLQIFQEEIDFMLKTSYILRSSLEYLYPIHLVPKKKAVNFVWLAIIEPSINKPYQIITPLLLWKIYCIA